MKKGKAMSEKVGIITFYGLNNYGNRLQNYAVQELFKELGFECETIVSAEFSVKTQIKFWIKTMIKRDGRPFSFRKFNRKYINLRVLKSHAILFPSTLSDEYRYFVVGSDQVWNPEIRQNQRKNFFLQFAKKEQRLTLSPSIAVPSIPTEWIDCYRIGLNGFKYISIREQSSVELIWKLTGKKATVLIDPTMALDREKWEAIEKVQKDIPNKYIVSLFLGNVNTAQTDFLQKVSRIYQCEIIDMNQRRWKTKGPDEFLYILHHASLVCTDSFHCTAFSIIFNIPFVVFRRQAVCENDAGANIVDRLLTLLDKFEFNHRMEDRIELDTIMKCDFKKSNEILNREKEKIRRFMRLQIEYEK